MVCVGGHVLSRSLWCVILIWNAWQCFTTMVCSKFFFFFFFIWFWGMMMPPILFDFFVCVFTLASFLIPLFDHAKPSSIKKWSGVCVRMFVCVWERESDVVAVHEKICIWMCCSLYSTSCLCFSVFPCGLALPALPCFCLFFLLFLLFLYDVYSIGWAANPLFCFVLIGLLLHKMLAVIGTPLVMWCALDWLCIIWVWPLSIWLHCV